MTALPVIVGMGGINASGRTSFHQGFRRIVLNLLCWLNFHQIILILYFLIFLVCSKLFFCACHDLTHRFIVR